MVVDVHKGWYMSKSNQRKKSVLKNRTSANELAPRGSGGATPLVDVGDIRREAVGGRRRRRCLAPPLPRGFPRSKVVRQWKGYLYKRRRAPACRRRSADGPRLSRKLGRSAARAAARSITERRRGASPTTGGRSGVGHSGASIRIN
ncbi:hypothetical protein EVAR_54282_1 [Eumeta japonica]|uniref:Uncharacterized protein n=1 Tax=Eumeta variegata TaxID=151549 RepID=A0A4C1YP16_EUMVA|nr:hypothetical protein EVAR_54282_1 [Eumeta japonica]